MREVAKALEDEAETVSEDPADEAADETTEPKPLVIDSHIGKELGGESKYSILRSGMHLMRNVHARAACTMSDIAAIADEVGALRGSIP